MSGDFDAALKLHQQHLRLARNLGDITATGRALGNIGKAYAGQRCHKQAIKFHKEELRVAREMGDRAAEGSTCGHLAVSEICTNTPLLFWLYAASVHSLPILPILTLCPFNN